MTMYGKPLVGDAVVVDLHGVLRLDARRRARLDLEAAPRIRALGELRPDELDRDAGPELLVTAEPNGPHAARADERPTRYFPPTISPSNDSPGGKLSAASDPIVDMLSPD